MNCAVALKFIVAELALLESLFCISHTHRAVKTVFSWRANQFLKVNDCINYEMALPCSYKQQLCLIYTHQENIDWQQNMS